MDPILLNSTVYNQQIQQFEISPINLSYETHTQSNGEVRSFESYLNDQMQTEARLESDRPQNAHQNKTESEVADSTENTEAKVANEKKTDDTKELADKKENLESDKKGNDKKDLVASSEGQKEVASKLNVQNPELQKAQTALLNQDIKELNKKPTLKIEEAVKALQKNEKQEIGAGVELEVEFKKETTKEGASLAQFEKSNGKEKQIKADVGGQTGDSSSSFKNTNDNALIANNVIKVDTIKPETPVSEIKSRFSQFLKESGTESIVRDAKIILGNQNSGEIKLILHPEKLGRIKIDLNIKDNCLVGKILVENNNIRDAFKETMAQLSQAFSDDGYDSIQLDLSSFGDDSRQQFESQPEMDHQVEMLAMSAEIENAKQVIGKNYYYQGDVGNIVNIAL